MVDEVTVMRLEIDKHSINITTCPTCDTGRLATFDVIALTNNGAGKITELTRCYKCDPHAE